MSSTDLTSTPGFDSALKSLLSRAIPYEKAGSYIPEDVLAYGLFGSLFVILTPLLTLALPSANSIRQSGFYLVLGKTIASLASFSFAAALPTAICGGVLLVTNLCLGVIRGPWGLRYVVVLQTAAGGITGAFCTVFLALVILNLAIWIGIGILGLMVIGIFFAALGGD
jgi:hypothetical protein